MSAEKHIWTHPGRYEQFGTFESELKCWFAYMPFFVTIGLRGPNVIMKRTERVGKRRGMPARPTASSRQDRRPAAGKTDGQHHKPNDLRQHRTKKEENLNHCFLSLWLIHPQTGATNRPHLSTGDCNAGIISMHSHKSKVPGGEGPGSRTRFAPGCRFCFPPPRFV